MKKLSPLIIKSLFLAIVIILSVSQCSFASKEAIAVATKEANAVVTKEANSFSLSCAGFNDGDSIPLKYAGLGVQGGGNYSLPLSWSGFPADTNSFALLMADKSSKTINWFVINIPSGTTSLLEGASPTYMPQQCVELRNDFGYFGYGGPQPSGSNEASTYEITVYALKTDRIDISGAPSVSDIKSAIENNLLSKGVLTGKF